MKFFTYNELSCSSRITSSGQTLNTSRQHVLDRIAIKGSWYGGGSAAALACALAAALVQKLARRPRTVAAAQAVRIRATRLIDEDARVFSRVIRAMAQQPRRFRPRLKAAIEVPWRVYDDSQRLLRLARDVGRGIPSRYQVDLRCAQTLARAAAGSARALIMTNLAWLNEPAYTRRMRQRLVARS